MFSSMEPFAALADPTRRDIVVGLARGEAAAGVIAARFPVSAPAISQHLKVLREAGLVRVEPRGQQRIYRLDPDGLEAIEQWIACTRATWNARFDALENAIESEEERRK